MDNNLVILAGGISSRMKDSLKKSPMLSKKSVSKFFKVSKSMIEFGEESKPFLDYLLTNAISAGYENIVFVINNKDTLIRSYYEQVPDIDKNNVNISFAIQEIPEGRKKPLGTADALLQALKCKTDWSGQKITVCNSDNLYSKNALSLIKTNQFNNALIDYDHSGLKFSREKIQKFAILLKNKQGYLADIIEKPSSSIYLHLLKKYGRIGVSMNLFRFDYDMIYPFLENVPFNPDREEKEIPDAVKMMINEHSKSVFAIPLSEHVPDLTDKLDIKTVEKYITGED